MLLDRLVAGVLLSFDLLLVRDFSGSCFSADDCGVGRHAAGRNADSLSSIHRHPKTTSGITAV
jgi:hypothetical protein